MSDHLIRVNNLKAIQRQRGWTDSELARQCGRSPQQVSSWSAGIRHIGEKLARDLEDRLEIPRYALDDPSLGVGGIHKTMEALPPLASGSQRNQSVTTKSKELPVMRWAEISTMLTVENATLRNKAPHLETFAPSSALAKFVEMPDDSMSPMFVKGDHVLLDPQEAPRAGDVVLVRVESGECFIRTFKPRSAFVFDAIPLNENYLPLSSQEDKAQVMAVMVEHRRYRRR